MASVLLIPPGKAFSPFEKLIYPFQNDVWISMLLVIALTVCVIIAYKQWTKRQITRYSFAYIDIVVIIIGNSQHRLPQRAHARLFLATFLLFSLVTRGLYQGALFRLMQTNRRHSELHSIDEMMEKDFKFYMYPSYQEHFKDMKFYSR